MSDEMPANAHALVPRLSLWQRACWWPGWPWRPRAVPPERREDDAAWVTVVRQGRTIIGWHLDDERPTGIGIGPDRWACLVGLLTGRLRFEVEIMPGDKGPSTVRAEGPMSPGGRG